MLAGLVAATAVAFDAPRAHAQAGASGSFGVSSEGGASADAGVAAPPATAPATPPPATTWTRSEPPTVLEQSQPVPTPAPLPTEPAPAPAAEPPPPVVTAPAPAVAADAGATAVPAESVNEAEDDRPFALTRRAYSTWNGSSGGIFVDDPGGMAEPGALRLQFAADTYSGDGFLYDGDTVEQDRQQVSVSWTAMRMLEVFASLSNRATSSDTPRHNSMHAFGDFELGLKVGVPIGELIRVGGSLRAIAVGDIGEHGSLLDATSVGARASGALDLQHLYDPVPLIVRLNVDYTLDNSGKVLDDIEALRFEELGDRADADDETRHLINRVERLGLGVNRVDLLTVGLGVEVPLELSDDIYLHPLAEYRLGMPINRQGFNCAYRSNDDERGTADAGADDTCLDDGGFDAWPMVATVGARFAPPIRGVSLTLGVDIGVTGTSTFVRELAPVPPYRVLIALGYGYDAQK